MSEKSEHRVTELAQEAGFDTDNIQLSHAIRALLRQIADKDTAI